jgi:hypothetical protein
MSCREEILFDAGSPEPGTVIFLWSQHAPIEAISLGYQAVDSNATHFYFTSPAPGGPTGWATVYYDIATGLNGTQLSMLLGGEMSMWR